MSTPGSRHHQHKYANENDIRMKLQDYSGLFIHLRTYDSNVVQREQHVEQYHIWLVLKLGRGMVFWFKKQLETPTLLTSTAVTHLSRNLINTYYTIPSFCLVHIWTGHHTCSTGLNYSLPMSAVILSMLLRHIDIPLPFCAWTHLHLSVYQIKRNGIFRGCQPKESTIRFQLIEFGTFQKTLLYASL